MYSWTPRSSRRYDRQSPLPLQFCSPLIHIPPVSYYSRLTKTRTCELGLGYTSEWLPNLPKTSSRAITSKSSKASRRFFLTNFPPFLSRSPRIALFSGLVLVLCYEVYPPNITQLPMGANWSLTRLCWDTSTIMDSVSAYFYPLSPITFFILL